MKTQRTVYVLLDFLLILGMLGFQKTDAIQKDNEEIAFGESKYVPNEVLVKFKKGISEYAIIQIIQAVSVDIVS